MVVPMLFLGFLLTQSTPSDISAGGRMVLGGGTQCRMMLVSQLGARVPPSPPGFPKGQVCFSSLWNSSRGDVPLQRVARAGATRH